MNNKYGFSLLEVMIAVVVLAALAIGGSATLSYSGSMIQRQQIQREAISVASSIMEKNIYDQARGLAWLNALEGNRHAEQVSVGNITYTAITTVSLSSEDAPDSTLHPNYSLVEVSLSSPRTETINLSYKAYTW